MRHSILTLLILSLALSACGVKGKLKRPSEIRQEEQKQKEKQQRNDGSL